MTRHRPRRRLPTYHELLIAPELAILGSVEASIDLAIVALVAAQPELWPTDDGHDAVMTAEARSAEHVITTAQALAVAIADYRTTLQRHLDRSPF